MDAPGYLPIKNIAPKIYPTLDRLCEDLLRLQKAATKAREARDEKHDQLNDAMHERKLELYKHEETGKTFYRSTTEKIQHKNAEKEKAAKKARAEKKGINPDSKPDDADDLDGGEEEIEVKVPAEPEPEPIEEEEEPANAGE